MIVSRSRQRGPMDFLFCLAEHNRKATTDDEIIRYYFFIFFSYFQMSVRHTRSRAQNVLGSRIVRKQLNPTNQQFKAPTIINIVHSEIAHMCQRPAMRFVLTHMIRTIHEWSAVQSMAQPPLCLSFSRLMQFTSQVRNVPTVLVHISILAANIIEQFSLFLSLSHTHTLGVIEMVI